MLAYAFWIVCAAKGNVTERPKVEEAILRAFRHALDTSLTDYEYLKRRAGR